MADAEGASGAALVLLVGDAETREAAENLGESLGVSVWAPAPDELAAERTDSWNNLRAARAVVAATEFGSRTGLELIEELAWSEPRPKGLALALPRPNRAWVEAACRAGATTCVCVPLESEDLAAKLDLNAPEGEGDDGAEAAEAEPAEGDDNGGEGEA